MPGTTGDQLRDLLRQQVQSASNEAVRSGGQVAVEQVEALERLARLVNLHQTVQPSPKHKRWPVVVVLGSMLLIVSLLLFVRVGETEIEFDLALSEVSFVLPTQQVLTEAVDLSTLSVSGLSEIQLPRARNRDAQTIRSSDGADSALRLSVVPEGKPPGSITLAPLILPTESHVWVRHIGLPHQYRLSVKGTNTEFRTDVNGPVQVGFSDGGTEQLDFVTPNAIFLQAGANEVDLDLTLLDPAQSMFSSQLSANDLSFFQIDEFRDLNKTIVRRVSTILSGTLYLAALNDQERKLRPGEMFHLEHAQGEFRTLRLQNDQIDVKFHGRVRGMSIGTGKNRRSLMPTWLEWLRARHGLSLLWGTALYLFGLIVGVLRWWGKPI